MENSGYSALATTRDVARAIRIVFREYSSIRLVQEFGRFELFGTSIRD
jgi:hypothetical protein